MSTARIGRVLLNNAIRRSRTGVLQSIASRDQSAAEEWKETHGFQTAWGSYEALLADPDVDAVYIPLPNHLHEEWSVKAAEAGKHVFVEKPASMDAAEAKRMAEAAVKHGVLLVENYAFRFHPQSALLRRTIDDGNVGDVRNMMVSFHNHMKKRESNIRLVPEMGGGVAMDLGSYMIAFSRLVFGIEPKSAVAFGDPDPTFGIDTTFNAVLEFGDNRTSTFATSFDNPGWQEARVLGTEGEIYLRNPLHPRGTNDGIYLRKEIPGDLEKQQALRDREESHIPVEVSDPFVSIVDAIGDHILKGTENPLLDPWECVRNMRVIDACRKSAKSGKRERIAAGEA